MDTRYRYGLGVLLLGLGNLAFGGTQLIVGGQSTMTIGLEVVVGVLLAAFGAVVVNDPERVDTEQMSVRVLSIIGWVGIVMGGAMVLYSVIVLATSL